MAHITIYKGTSKPYKRFRSTNGVNKFLKETFKDNTERLIFKETLSNYFSIQLNDGTKTLYSMQIVEWFKIIDLLLRSLTLCKALFVMHTPTARASAIPITIAYTSIILILLEGFLIIESFMKNWFLILRYLYLDKFMKVIWFYMNSWTSY